MQRTITKRTFQTMAFVTLLLPIGIWLLRFSNPLPCSCCPSCASSTPSP